jgi:DNA polymerase III psi subunit
MQSKEVSPEELAAIEKKIQKKINLIPVNKDLPKTDIAKLKTIVRKLQKFKDNPSAPSLAKP